MPERRDRWLLVGAWLATAVVVTTAALFAYHFATRVPDLAGRRDPVDLYADPTLLFSDPGILGTAVEMQVTEAVRDCMGDAGLTYRGPALIEGIDSLIDPTRDGYGIAAGPQVEKPHLGAGGPAASDREAYEAALYGTGLAGGAEGPGEGCAAAGRAALTAALATLGSLPYSLVQLEADASAHPAYTAALGQWSDCMAESGFMAASPEELVAAQVQALATVSGDDARALADRERQIAAADFACRSRTLDPAVQVVAADLAPRFIEQNRRQLAALIPPPDGGGGDAEGLGTGDVQVTLRWTSTVDLDLLVTDPDGSLVSYRSPTVVSGGSLDRDANYPCEAATPSPVENVFWPPQGAPPGLYRATVLYQTGCATAGTQPYELIVRIDGKVAEQVLSTIEPGQEITIEFTFEGA
jgi:hypothetical protein